MVHDIKKKYLLLLTRNRIYIEEIRKLCIPCSDLKLTTVSNFSESSNLFENIRHQLILLDTETSESSILLERIYTLYLNHRTILIVPTLSEFALSKYICMGFPFVADFPTTLKMLPAFLKLISKNHQIENLFKKQFRYHSLTVIPSQRAIFLKGCQIKLPEKSIKILVYLIEHNGESDSLSISQYLSNFYMRTISPKEVSIHICRLNKAVKNVTGLKLVKSRYKLGYRIAI